MVPSTKRSILITGYVDSCRSLSTLCANSVVEIRCSQGGAGNALALEFSSRGFRVFATARSLTSMTNLESAGVEIFTLDVTSLDSIKGLKDEIHNRTGGKLDILFNNAGTSKPAALFQLHLVSSCGLSNSLQCMRRHLLRLTVLVSDRCLTPTSSACSTWFRHSHPC
jgi:short-subunit dehydrogenase